MSALSIGAGEAQESACKGVSCAEAAVVPYRLARLMVSKGMQLVWFGGAVRLVCAGGGPFGDRRVRAAVTMMLSCAAMHT